MAAHHDIEDPALRNYGPKPTDRDLPQRERTSATPYGIVVVLIFLAGLALVAVGITRFSQSSEDISNTPGAVAPSEELVPSSQESGGSTLDREVAPTMSPDATNDGSVTVPGAN